MEWCKYNYMFFSKYSKSYLLYSSLSNQIVELSEEGYEEVKEIMENPDSFDISNKEHHFLLEGKFIVESNDAIVSRIIAQNNIRRYNSDILYLTIAPTQACNFACPYCYETDKPNVFMSSEVQNRVIDFIKNHSKIKSIHIVWYGGEPTLALDIIRNLSLKIKELNIKYSSYMVTNGYLLNNLIEDIDLLNLIGLQITLDGTPEYHNATRILRNGGATFTKIIDNIEMLLSKHKMSINIRMNINKKNSVAYVALHDFLKNKFGNKVNLYPAFVVDYGKNCKSGHCYENTIDKATYLKNLYLKHGIYTNDLYPMQKFKGCMSQQLNSYVIDPNGKLYKCWHDLGQDKMSVGDISNPKIINNLNLLYQKLIHNDTIYDRKCIDCILFPSCYGGCVDNKNKEKDYCVPSKSMIEDFIELRYIRNSNLRKSKENICSRTF